MKIQCFHALDFFDDCTLTIPEWLDKTHEAHARGRSIGRTEASALFIAAAALYHQYGDNELRLEPRVGYVPDQRIFIFKENNNGTTYVVSEHGIEHDNEDTSFVQEAVSE